jgi:hypothetical protein
LQYIKKCKFPMGISIEFYKYAKNIPSLFIAFSSVVKANFLLR